MTARISSKQVLNEKTGKWKTVNTYFVNGKEVSKKKFDKAFPSKLNEVLNTGVEVNTDRPSCWPRQSIALKVHSEQVDEANAALKAAGLKSYHDKMGVLHIPDKTENKKLLKHRGLFDKNAFC